MIYPGRERDWKRCSCFSRIAFPPGLWYIPCLACSIALHISSLAECCRSMLRHESLSRLVVRGLVAQGGIVELCIGSPPGEEGGMIAFFHDTTVIQDDDPVGMADGRQPVGNEQAGTCLKEDL